MSTPTGAPPSGPTGAPPSGPTPDADGHAWHALSADLVLQAEHVDAQEGLSSAEVLARTQRFGPNKFDSGKAESRWRAFLRQYADPMQIVLLVAGVVSLYPLKELETGILLLASDVVQRGARPAAGGQGGRRGRGAAEDDDRQGQGHAGRRARRDPSGRARSRRCRGHRGRRHHSGRRPAAAGGDAGGRRVRADRGEPAGVEGHRPGERRRHPARRPHRHGVHEHQCHPRLGRVRGHRDRDGHRGRPHLGHAAGGGDRQDPRSPGNSTSSPSRSS